jgi:predicted dinucleotide-binding enzyme
MPLLAALSAEIALVVLVAIPAAAVIVVVAAVVVALTVIVVAVTVGWLLTRASAAVLGEGAEIWR